jgi:hypothetical protein
MRLIVALMSLICLVPAASLAGDDNPYKKAKIGDWIEYRLTGTIQGTTKMTVVAKDDKEVSLEVTGTYSFMGMETVPERPRFWWPFDPGADLGSVVCVVWHKPLHHFALALGAD